MPIQTTVVGSYPKPPEEGQTFTVRKTLHALERGDASTDDLRDAQDMLVAEVIRDQQDAGIDIVTDGLARWDDIVTPFARNLAGFEIGGLLRWFDNNVYYRRPIARGAVEWRGPSSVESYRFAAQTADRPVKAIIPGPVSFAHLSVNEHYADHESFVLALASVLAQEAAELEAAGAPIIQIDEPSLLGAPEDLELAIQAVGQITSGLSEARTVLATYFGEAKRLGTDIFRVPADVFGFDLISGPENIELIRTAPDDKGIQAGIVDARNTMLETEGALTRTIEGLVGLVGSERLSVSPSAGLEFLPREKARAKLQRLAATAKKVGA